MAVCVPAGAVDSRRDSRAAEAVYRVSSGRVLAAGRASNNRVRVAGRVSNDRVRVAGRVSNDRVSGDRHSREEVRSAGDVRRILETLSRSNLLRNLFLPPARHSSAQCLTRRI